MAVNNERVKAEATQAVGSMISLVTAVLASPADAVTNYVSGEDKKTSFQLIGVQLVAVTVAHLLNRILSALFSKYSSFSIGTLLSTALHDVVAILVVMAVAAFIITILAKQGGVDVSFNKALSIASLQAIAVTPGYVIYYLISSLGVSILSNLSSIILSGTQVLAIILTFYGFNVVVNDKKKLFYGIGAYFVVLLLVNWIIGRLF